MRWLCVLFAAICICGCSQKSDLVLVDVKDESEVPPIKSVQQSEAPPELEGLSTEIPQEDGSKTPSGNSRMWISIENEDGTEQIIRSDSVDYPADFAPPPAPPEIWLDCQPAHKAIGGEGIAQVVNWTDFSDEGRRKLASNRLIESLIRQQTEWTDRHNSNFETVQKLGYRYMVFLVVSEDPFDWEASERTYWKLVNPEIPEEFLEFNNMTPLLTEGYPKATKVLPLALSFDSGHMAINEFEMPPTKLNMKFWGVAVFKARPYDEHGLEPGNTTEQHWPGYDQNKLNKFKLVPAIQPETDGQTK